MENSNRSYVYEPLSDDSDANEIRLVSLLPSDDFAAPVRCAISKVSLNDPHFYEALSYTWGELKSPKAIYVEDREHRVTTNLELAFRYLRLRDRIRTIWADALCINQMDLIEKASQVQKMRTIYLSARQVVVWLGEEADSKPALALCKGVISPATTPSHRQESKLKSKKSSGILGNISSFIKSKFTKPKWKIDRNYNFSEEELVSCSALFSRPWWSRTWILQEVIHSRPVWVYVGHFQVELDELSRLHRVYRKFEMISSDILELKKAGSRVPEGRSTLRLLWSAFLNGIGVAATVIPIITSTRELVKEAKELDLLGFLSIFRRCLATDPRDKVFAFLGMTSESTTSSGIQIDYTASKRRVYTDTARHLSARILPLVESFNREVDPSAELPSWVPDFTIEQQYITQMMPHSFFRADYGLSEDDYHYADHQWSLNGPEDDRYRLRLMGIYVGIITSVIAGHVTQSPSLKDEDQVKLFKYNTDIVRRYRPADEPCLTSADLDHVMKTNWGPIKAEKEDIVVVAIGCNIPIVLRKEEDHYLFVGVCWLIDSQLPEPDDLEKGTGFSPIMFGSACGKESRVEEFMLH